MDTDASKTIEQNFSHAVQTRPLSNQSIDHSNELELRRRFPGEFDLSGFNKVPELSPLAGALSPLACSLNWAVSI